MNRKLAISICFLAIVLAVAFCLSKSEIFNRHIPTSYTNAGYASVPMSPRTNAQMGTQALIAEESTPSVSSNDRTKTIAIQQYMESLNKPIYFFGQVVDQNGNPVSGVKVKANVRHIKVIVPTAWGSEDQIISIETETDIGGRFAVSNVTGVGGLEIVSVQKPGYELSPNTAVHFDSTDCTPERPSVVKMWKYGESAELTSWNKFWGVIPDGRTYTIDLLRGSKSESTNIDGDVQVSVVRPAGVQRNERYNWAFQIMPINGGILETNDDFMYQAPEGSYQSKYEFQIDASDDPWRYRVRKQFFVKVRGKYARIYLEVFALYQDQAAIKLSWAINATGSRNLQP